MSSGVSDSFNTLRLFRSFVSTKSPQTRAELIEIHLGLAKHLARKYVDRNVPQDDLVQIASLGLIKAVDGFDPNIGVEFSTYAVRTIVGELKHYFRDKSWFIRVPRRLQEIYLEYNSLFPLMSNELKRPPSVIEMADRMKVSIDDVLFAIEAPFFYALKSLDDQASNRTGEYPRPDDNLIDATTLESYDDDFSDIFPSLSQLPNSERKILKLKFTNGLSQTQIANELNISQIQVSRLLLKSLNTLRLNLATK